MGADDQALPLYQRSLQIIEKSLGPKHPHAITTLTNLGALYMARKDYQTAAAYFQRARSTGGLVEVWLARGQPGKALKLLRRPAPDPAGFAGQTGAVRYATGSGPGGGGAAGGGGLGPAPGRGGGGGLAPPGPGRTDRLLPGRHLWRLCAALPGTGDRPGGDVPQIGGPTAGAPGVRTGAGAAAFYFAESTKARALLEAMAQGARQQTRAETPPNCGSGRKAC